MVDNEQPVHPDPRVLTSRTDEGVLVEGVRCSSCGHAAAHPRLRCPRCRADVAVATFGPEGIVWASTVVRVPVPGRTPPYGLAYVDLDEGPRVLAHVANVPEPVPVGTRVRLTERTKHGDLQVEVT